jgi:protocatechuate 3,4-dioxygenase alpha subunit
MTAAQRWTPDVVPLPDRPLPDGPTPSQTVGPFLVIGLTWPDGRYAVPAGTPGAIRIGGRLLDGAGEPINDGMIETWQADPDGRFDHPDDPRGAVPRATGHELFGRALTDADGRWEIVTVRPGPIPGPDGSTQAPHLAVSVFARGMLNRVVTRIYLPEQAGLEGPGGHADDPVLRSVPEQRRSSLVAEAVDDGYRFDIRLQGEAETVFFQL